MPNPAEFNKRNHFSDGGLVRIPVDKQISTDRQQPSTRVVEETTFFKKTYFQKELGSTPKFNHNLDVYKLNLIQQEIIQIILVNSDISTILNKMARKIAEFFQIEACVIVVGDLNSGRSEEVAGWWQNQESSSVGEQIKNQLALEQSQSNFITTSVSKEENIIDFWQNIVRKNLPCKTILPAAIKNLERVNGAIFLLQPESYQWTTSEQELLKQISDSMAIAISQIQLQQQNQTKIKYQNLLNYLSQEISQNSNPDTLLANCLMEIGQTLAVAHATILTIKYQEPLRTKRSQQQLIKGKVKIACHWDGTTQDIDNQNNSVFNLRDSQHCQQAWQLAPKYLATEENTNFPDLLPSQLPAGIDSHSGALLMMPLMGKKPSQTHPALVLGFLVLQYNKPHIWQSDELDLINWISVQISTAIIHHQTLNQVQSIVEERTAQLKWSLDVQAKLSEKMRHQIQELQKLNQLKDDFLNSMSHELKTPLTSMKMAIKMLRQTQLPPSMQDKYLNILEQEWNREYNLIKDLLTLQQVESGELTYRPQELNLEEKIEELTASFTDKWHSHKGLTLKTTLADSALNVYTDAESLEHILSELLLNAGKYSDADTTIELSASSTKGLNIKDKKIAIAISSYGTEIAKDELPHIFDKFRRGQGVTDRAVPGTGLGLTLVKHLVDHLNGSIEVSSEPVDNSEVYLTTFTVSLPQYQ